MTTKPHHSAVLMQKQFAFLPILTLVTMQLHLVWNHRQLGVLLNTSEHQR